MKEQNMKYKHISVSLKSEKLWKLGRTLFFLCFCLIKTKCWCTSTDPRAMHLVFGCSSSLMIFIYLFIWSGTVIGHRIISSTFHFPFASCSSSLQETKLHIWPTLKLLVRTEYEQWHVLRDAVWEELQASCAQVCEHMGNSYIPSLRLTNKNDM